MNLNCESLVTKHNSEAWGRQALEYNFYVLCIRTLFNVISLAWWLWTYCLLAERWTLLTENISGAMTLMQSMNIFFSRFPVFNANQLGWVSLHRASECIIAEVGPRLWLVRLLCWLEPGPGPGMKLVPLVTAGYQSPVPVLVASAANPLIGEVVQSQRRPLLGPSPSWKRLLALSHLRHYYDTMLNVRWPYGFSMWNWVRDTKVKRDGRVG